ncbi:MAG TPA: 50S ribosomal protein L32 [bacterium]|nr:50S ribosomal protein L32 [bacterium]HPP86739.1 50S ribosomal protein L32 [bacterium]
MAVPKRKPSKSVVRKRKATWKRSIEKIKPTLVECSHCHNMKRAHCVCPHCGYYKGRQVLTIKSKKKEN